VTTNIRHVDRHAGGAQRFGEGMHAGAGKSRAVDQNSDFVRLCRIGVILQLRAIASPKLPGCRKVRLPLPGGRCHRDHCRRRYRCIERNHKDGDHRDHDKQAEHTEYQFMHLCCSHLSKVHTRLTASLAAMSDQSGLGIRARYQCPVDYGCRAEAAMISCRVATWRANAPRPEAVAVTVVCGFLPTKAFSTAT